MKCILSGYFCMREKKTMQQDKHARQVEWVFAYEKYIICAKTKETGQRLFQSLGNSSLNSTLEVISWCSILWFFSTTSSKVVLSTAYFFWVLLALDILLYNLQWWYDNGCQRKVGLKLFLYSFLTQISETLCSVGFISKTSFFVMVFSSCGKFILCLTFLFVS